MAILQVPQTVYELLPTGGQTRIFRTRPVSLLSFLWFVRSLDFFSPWYKAFHQWIVFNLNVCRVLSLARVHSCVHMVPRLPCPWYKLIHTSEVKYIFPPSKAHGEGNGTPLQYSCLENPIDWGAWWAAVHGVTKSRTRLSDFTFTFHFHALGKEMASHSSVLAWRIPGTGEPGGLPSMGSHRVGHDWSDLAAVAAAKLIVLDIATA